MEKKYKFDAFISYRHCDLDKYVAENLHKLIETYKMPKSVVEKYNIMQAPTLIIQSKDAFQRLNGVSDIKGWLGERIS